MRKTALAAAVLMAATAFCAAADTITIAITGPFSGGSAPMGTSMRDGAKLAIEEINKAGGVDVGGKKMKIVAVERDDEAKNERGALVAQELASMPDLSGVIGTVNTGVAIAGDKYLQEKGITKIITPAAGTGSMTPWTAAGGNVKDLSIFRFSADDTLQSAMVIEEAIRRGFTKVSVLTDSTNYGVSGYHDLFKRNTEQGNKLQIVATDTFNIGDKDMTAQLLKAKAAGAQAVLIWGIGPELAAVANGMAKLDFRVPLIGGWPLSMSNFIDNAGANGNGALMPQTFIEEPISPKARAFIDAYHKAYHVSRIPSAMSAAQGYDAVYLMAAAIKQAKSAETHAIKAALEDLKEPVHGVIATWRHPYSAWDPMNEDTHEAFRREQVVMGAVKDGRVVFADQADRERLTKAGRSK